MSQEDASPENMGPEDMGPEDMGPEDAGPEDAGPMTRRPDGPDPDAASPLTEAPPTLEAAVGAAVRATRASLGVTLADLSRSASISLGMLSKIENGQTSPSLSTLQALATALNVPIGAFFARYDEKREATFVKGGEGLRIERRGSSKGHLYQLLGHSLRGATRVEPFLITLDENADAYPIFQHPGVEFIYMLEGAVSYRHGGAVYDMEPGDSLFFDAEAPHGPLDLRSLPAVYLSIIFTPTPAAA